MSAAVDCRSSPAILGFRTRAAMRRCPGVAAGGRAEMQHVGPTAEHERTGLGHVRPALRIAHERTAYTFGHPPRRLWRLALPDRGVDPAYDQPNDHQEYEDAHEPEEEECHCAMPPGDDA